MRNDDDGNINERSEWVRQQTKKKGVSAVGRHQRSGTCVQCFALASPFGGRCSLHAVADAALYAGCNHNVASSSKGRTTVIVPTQVIHVCIVVRCIKRSTMTMLVGSLIRLHG